MQAELNEIHWLDQYHELSLYKLAELSGMSESALHELVEIGTLVPIDPRATPWTFRADCIAAVRTAVRLSNDFELDAHALALTLDLLDRIHELEAQLRDVRAHLPRRMR